MSSKNRFNNASKNVKVSIKDIPIRDVELLRTMLEINLPKEQRGKLLVPHGQVKAKWLSDFIHRLAKEQFGEKFYESALKQIASEMDLECANSIPDSKQEPD